MADPKSQQAGGAPASASGNASNDPPATQAEYKKSQQRIRELIRKKAQMESRLVRKRQTPLSLPKRKRKLHQGVVEFALTFRVADDGQNSIEDTIAQKELGYLENTQSGNIITGFDNYMKGQAGAAAQRKKTASMEQNRIFSKSSISYKPNQNVRFAPSTIPVFSSFLLLQPLLTWWD